MYCIEQYYTVPLYSNFAQLFLFCPSLVSFHKKIIMPQVATKWIINTTCFNDFATLVHCINTISWHVSILQWFVHIFPFYCHSVQQTFIPTHIVSKWIMSPTCFRELKTLVNYMNTVSWVTTILQ